VIAGGLELWAPPRERTVFWLTQLVFYYFALITLDMPKRRLGVNHNLAAACCVSGHRADDGEFTSYRDSERFRRRGAREDRQFDSFIKLPARRTTYEFSNRNLLSYNRFNLLTNHFIFEIQYYH
jgi:hypothetical protein